MFSKKALASAWKGHPWWRSVASQRVTVVRSETKILFSFLGSQLSMRFTHRHASPSKEEGFRSGSWNSTCRCSLENRRWQTTRRSGNTLD